MKHCGPAATPFEFRVRCQVYNDANGEGNGGEQSTGHGAGSAGGDGNGEGSAGVGGSAGGAHASSPVLLAAGVAGGRTVMSSAAGAASCGGVAVARACCVLPLANCLAPWSAERPKLYTLLLVLETRSSGGSAWAAREAVAARVGFRTAAVRGGRLRVNGKAVVLKVRWNCCVAHPAWLLQPLKPDNFF